MNRRTFVEAIGSMGMTAMGAVADGRKAKYLLLQNYYLRQSTQLGRLHEFMSQGFLPAAAKIHRGPKIFLEAQVAAHVPQFVTLMGLESLEELGSLPSRLREDSSFQKAVAAWEYGPEPPYEHFACSLLQTTDYCPDIPPELNKGKRRIYELRTYHSPTSKQLAALHQRFAGPEMKIFHRSGIYPIVYSETLVGANMPNLTYLIPFENLAAREKAWETFQADAEWVKVRNESIEQHGQISSVIQVSLFRSTAYSPIG